MMAQSDRLREQLFRGAFELTADSSPPAVARRALDLACTLIGADHGSLLLLRDDADELELVTHGGGGEGSLVGRSVIDAVVLRQVIGKGRPVRLGRLAANPVLLGLSASTARFLGVPITVWGRVSGALCLGRPEGGPEFNEEEEQEALRLGRHLGIALSQARVLDEARSSERLSLLEERERIAMDLHDGVVQALFVVGLSLQAAQAVPDDAQEVAARLADAVGSIDGAIRDLRDYIFGLQPEEVDDHQLERSLRDVAATIRRSSGVTTLVEVEAEAASKLAGDAPAITHIAREAMSNAVRHSGGDRVTLRLRQENGEVALEVCDNGSGFDPRRVEGSGNGLSNLRARAESLGGELRIDSEAGVGSIVCVRVPV